MIPRRALVIGPIHTMVVEQTVPIEENWLLTSNVMDASIRKILANAEPYCSVTEVDTMTVIPLTASSGVYYEGEPEIADTFKNAAAWGQRAYMRF